uniref:ubiquitinyl hydrolase 1 n=1 Tax=Chelonoidis abingdonii TaxID=106734 RepID=A0A8C0IWG9_CHEAB
MRPCRFFILVQDFSGGGGRQVPRGSLLSHAGELPSPDCAFWAKLLDTEAMVQVPARAVRELSKEQARMLQALTNGDERLELFRQEGLLGRRGALRPGDRVRVQITSASGEKVRGVLRYRGPMGDSKEQAGVIFGVELVVSEGGGFTDGAFRGQKFFSCRENCGVFVPVSRIEPDEGSELQLAAGDPLKSPPLELGDRVFFRMGDSAPKGTVVFCDYLPKKEMTGVFVGIFLDQPVGSWDGKFKDQSLCHLPSPEYGILLPIAKVHKGRTYSKQQGREALWAQLHCTGHWPCPCHAVTEIQQPFSSNKMAALMAFLPAISHSRSASPLAAFRVYASERVPEDTPPGLGEEGGQRLIGWKKGIQGHCNSCYLDATLFCMFAFSSVLDSLLLRPADKNDGASYEETRDLLRTEIIVNPLRKHGYVCATKVMSLRRVLEAAGHSPGFTSEEKDPEEFLTLLFRVLKVEPLFKIRSADKDPQGCIFYQIFMEGSAGGARRGVPTVQQLLEGSLAAGDLKFTEEKQCGGGWPWGAGAVTDTPPTALAAPRECCICQALALSECPQCFGDPSIGAGSTRQYCALCCQQVHRHRARRSHRPRALCLPPELEHLPPPPGPLPRQTMQLYATLCIQTSHYVAFARHGPHRGQWLFFDSMADRQGGQNGFNIPQVTPCPEVADYLEMSPEELQVLDPKCLPPCARRLLCDAYMCLYHSPTLGLYK